MDVMTHCKQLISQGRHGQAVRAYIDAKGGTIPDAAKALDIPVPIMTAQGRKAVHIIGADGKVIKSAVGLSGNAQQRRKSIRAFKAQGLGIRTLY